MAQAHYSFAPAHVGVATLRRAAGASSLQFESAAGPWHRYDPRAAFAPNVAWHAIRKSSLTRAASRAVKGCTAGAIDNDRMVKHELNRGRRGMQRPAGVMPGCSRSILVNNQHDLRRMRPRRPSHFWHMADGTASSNVAAARQTARVALWHRQVRTASATLSGYARCVPPVSLPSARRPPQPLQVWGRRSRPRQAMWLFRQGQRISSRKLTQHGHWRQEAPGRSLHQGFTRPPLMWIPFML